MPDTPSAPALRRLVRPPRRADPLAPYLATLRRGIAQAADARLGLDAELAGATLTDTDRAALLAGWDAGALSVLVTTSAGRHGLLTLDPVLRTGLIEWRTMRRLLTSDPAARPATPIDAHLTAPILADWLAVLDPLTGPLRIADRVDSAKAAALVLEEGGYGRLDLTISLGDGARRGGLSVTSPAQSPRRSDSPPLRIEHGPDLAPATETPAELVGILASVPMTVAQLGALAPGSCLSVPDGAIDSVRLEDARGRTVGRARLGQRNGYRALRLLALSNGSRGGQGAGSAPVIEGEVAPQPLPEA